MEFLASILNEHFPACIRYSGKKLHDLVVEGGGNYDGSAHISMAYKIYRWYEGSSESASEFLKLYMGWSVTDSHSKRYYYGSKSGSNLEQKCRSLNNEFNKKYEKNSKYCSDGCNKIVHTANGMGKLCYLCPLSPEYTNARIDAENTVLGYALTRLDTSFIERVFGNFAGPDYIYYENIAAHFTGMYPVYKADTVCDMPYNLNGLVAYYIIRRAENIRNGNIEPQLKEISEKSAQGPNAIMSALMKELYNESETLKAGGTGYRRDTNKDYSFRVSMPDAITSFNSAIISIVLAGLSSSEEDYNNAADELSNVYSYNGYYKDNLPYSKPDRYIRSLGVGSVGLEPSHSRKKAKKTTSEKASAKNSTGDLGANIPGSSTSISKPSVPKYEGQISITDALADLMNGEDNFGKILGGYSTMDVTSTPDEMVTVNNPAKEDMKDAETKDDEVSPEEPLEKDSNSEEKITESVPGNSGDSECSSSKSDEISSEIHEEEPDNLSDAYPDFVDNMKKELQGTTSSNSQLGENTASIDSNVSTGDVSHDSVSIANTDCDDFNGSFEDIADYYGIDLYPADISPDNETKGDEGSSAQDFDINNHNNETTDAVSVSETANETPVHVPSLGSGFTLNSGYIPEESPVETAEQPLLSQPDSSGEDEDDEDNEKKVYSVYELSGLSLRDYNFGELGTAYGLSDRELIQRTAACETELSGTEPIAVEYAYDADIDTHGILVYSGRDEKFWFIIEQSYHFENIIYRLFSGERIKLCMNYPAIQWYLKEHGFKSSNLVSLPAMYAATHPKDERILVGNVLGNMVHRAEHPLKQFMLNYKGCYYNLCRMLESNTDFFERYKHFKYMDETMTASYDLSKLSNIYGPGITTHNYSKLFYKYNNREQLTQNSGYCVLTASIDKNCLFGVSGTSVITDVIERLAKGHIFVRYDTKLLLASDNSISLACPIADFSLINDIIVDLIKKACRSADNNKTIIPKIMIMSDMA